MPRVGWNWPLIGVASLLAMAVARPYAASWNDGSRLAMVEALVDHHTFAIDRSIFVDVPEEGPSPYPPDLTLLRRGTQDKLFIAGHWYSDKPPLPGLFLALVYWLLQSLTGLEASQGPGLFCYALTLANSGLAYVLAVACIERLARVLDLSRPHCWLLVGSFALCTVTVVYTQHVSSHLLMLGLTALLTLQLVELAKGAAPTSHGTRSVPATGGGPSWWRLVGIGLTTGLAYAADLGIGPPLVVATFGLVLWRTRSLGPVALFLLGTLPGFLLHHAVNYAIGGTLQPANAVPEYLAWPGSPFSAATMTGQLNHPTPFHFLAYAFKMLFNNKGFLLHNLPLLLLLPLAFGPWRDASFSSPPLKSPSFIPEVLWAVSFSLLGWLAYAATSNNYSGVCLSIRWFIPLIAPLYLPLALSLRRHPRVARDFCLLSAWGLLMMALAWYRGPWGFGLVPGFWFLVGGAFLSWGLLHLPRSRQRFSVSKRQPSATAADPSAFS